MNNNKILIITKKDLLTLLIKFRLAPLCINIKMMSVCPTIAAIMTGVDPS